MRLGASLHFGERQRRSDLQPRVAPQALPWVSASERTQPQRGCGGTARHPGRNPFRVEGYSCVSSNNTGSQAAQSLFSVRPPPSEY